MSDDDETFLMLGNDSNGEYYWGKGSHSDMRRQGRKEEGEISKGTLSVTSGSHLSSLLHTSVYFFFYKLICPVIT